MAIQCLASDHTTTFLVDSQADISVIKSTSIKKKSHIDTETITEIFGVTHGSVKSLGTLHTSLITPNKLDLPIQLVVVSPDFPIPVDGIIGRDFIKKYRCNLDYLNFTFSIRPDNDVINIPILDHTMSNSHYVIPGRCEVIRHFRLVNTDPEDAVID